MGSLGSTTITNSLFDIIPKFKDKDYEVLIITGKDYYDMYLIYSKEWDKVKIDNLKRAINNTFSKRNFVCEPYSIIDTIENSDDMIKRWNA